MTERPFPDNVDREMTRQALADGLREARRDVFVEFTAVDDIAKELEMANLLEAYYRNSILSLCDLIDDLIDDEECDFDHHGGCQAHGYLSLQPGEICPNEDGRRRVASVAEELAEWRTRIDDEDTDGD